MAFTTWSALKTSILDAIADGSILTQSYTIAGRTRTFRNLDEVMRFLSLCDRMIAAEGGGMTAYATFKDPGSAS